MKRINNTNFFINTRTYFEECKEPKRKPDYISKSAVTGKISSLYWYEKEGVIRKSNHWGGVASCCWAFKGFSKSFLHCEVNETELIGYSSYKRMEEINGEYEIINDDKMKVLSSEYFKLPENEQSFVNAGSTKKGVIAMDLFKKRSVKLFKLI